MRHLYLPAFLLFLSPMLAAEPLDYIQHYHDNSSYDGGFSFRPLLAYESSDTGQITSLGMQWGGGAGDYLALVTSLSNFQAKQKFGGDDISFSNFDTSLRLGYFDDVSLYAEVGVALDELVFDEEEKDYYDRYGFHHSHSGPIDWFAGVGGGLQLDFLQINAFARYRYLRSLEQEFYSSVLWQQGYLPMPSPHQWFAGVELSIRF
jgi:hypothetical protein